MCKIYFPLHTAQEIYGFIIIFHVEIKTTLVWTVWMFFFVSVHM